MTDYRPTSRHSATMTSFSTCSTRRSYHCNRVHSSIARKSSCCRFYSSMISCWMSFCLSASMNCRVDSPWFRAIYSNVHHFMYIRQLVTKLSTIDTSKIDSCLFYLFTSLSNSFFPLFSIWCNYRYYNFLCTRGCHVIISFYSNYWFYLNSSRYVCFF